MNHSMTVKLVLLIVITVCLTATAMAKDIDPKPVRPVHPTKDDAEDAENQQAEELSAEIEETGGYRTLQNGDSGEGVERLMQRLIELGYMTVESEETYGAATAEAVRWFQEVVGLPATGVADEETQRVIFMLSVYAPVQSVTPEPTIEPTPEPTPKPQRSTLQRGDSGNDVKRLQKRLIKLGYLKIDVVDGNYGENEEAAIKAFQEACDLEVTGIADGITQIRLFDNSAKRAASYQQLKKGDKGEDVKKLQKRLIELNYLESGADGDYGNKTKNAVERFQSAAGLPVTGVADSETQKALYASSAPKSKTYQKMNFKALSRDPDRYMDEFYVFSGEVIQVLEEEQWDGTTLVNMRIATKEWYDDVVMVEYKLGSGQSRILEDDKVTVYGQYKGLYTYESIMGAKITVPLFLGEQVSLK